MRHEKSIQEFFLSNRLRNVKELDPEERGRKWANCPVEAILNGVVILPELDEVFPGVDRNM